MPTPLEIITLTHESSTTAPYNNHSIAQINDHEVRISIMTEPYHWHAHPDSDETFLSLEGGLYIDVTTSEGDRTLELHPGQLVTIPRATRHRTRPMAARSVNLTFERKDAASQPLPAPPAE